jgi:hypothetical protein
LLNGPLKHTCRIRRDYIWITHEITYFSLVYGFPCIPPFFGALVYLWLVGFHPHFGFLIKLTVHKDSRWTFNSNQTYPIGVKVEISPKCFTLGVKAEIEKIFSIYPKLLINAKPSNLGSQLETLGPMV